MMGEGVAWFGAAVAFAVAMSATPGPNNTMVAASGARFGVVRTMPHMLGVSAGFPVMLVAVALGAGDILQGNRWLQVTLRWVGVAYLLWLAWSIARAPTTMDEKTEAGRRPLGFLRAALFQWVNPKAWIIAVGAVVTYTEGDGRFGQTLVLAGIFAVACLPCLLFWTSIGAGVARLLRSERALRRFDLAMAALLVLSLVPVLFE
jgi:threonine/homoserine/homoserine lactone efflux protein